MFKVKSVLYKVRDSTTFLKVNCNQATDKTSRVMERLRNMNPKNHGSNQRLHISELETWFLRGPGIHVHMYKYSTDP